jgi:D-2-hydroxyglutarate dehydrogenase
MLLLCRYTKPQPVVELMNKVKKVFDPNGILNPYKVLPHVEAVAQ